MDELTVEVRESEEGLDVLNLPQFRPIGDGLNFLCRHGESVGCNGSVFFFLSNLRLDHILSYHM